MRINCFDLPCPEPVLRTKKALETLPDDAILEVELNTTSSIANVQRLAKNMGYDCRVEELPDGTTLISVIKGFLCEISTSTEANEKENKGLQNRTLFLKHDGVGEGELGKKLIHGFLKSLLEFKNLPQNIIFVNRGVLLTTDTKNYSEVIEILKELELRGIKIYSCGLCMEHLGIDAKTLQVGEIGNAYDTMDMLLNSEVVSI